jgi:hypothetical protein
MNAMEGAGTPPGSAGVRRVWGVWAGDAWGRLEGSALCAYSVVLAWAVAVAGPTTAAWLDPSPKPGLNPGRRSC